MTSTRATHKTGRHLILIDIENMTATPSPTTDEVAEVVAALRKVVPGFDDDQKIVACSHHRCPDRAVRVPDLSPSLAVRAGRSRPGLARSPGE